MLLGLAGGAAGLAVHAYMLAGLMAQSAPASEEVKRLAVGVALGAAGIAAVSALLVSRPAGITFMLSLAILGLFPNSLTWSPAAALMIVAGTLGLVELRRPVSPDSAAGNGTVRPMTPAPLTDTHDAPLHWSLAARYASAMPSTQVAQAPVTQHVQPLPPTVSTGRGSWSLRSKALVGTTIVATALVVVPFSLWPQETVAAAQSLSDSGGSVVAAAAVTPTTGPTGKAATPAALAVERQSPTSTTLVTTLSAVGPTGTTDPSSFVLYSDVRFGLTVAMPADWAELPASSLGDYRAEKYNLAAFAEVSGPTHQGAYLNGLTIKVLAGSQTEDPPQELIHQTLQQLVDGGPATYDYFKVLKPIRETTVGGMAAAVVTFRTTWNDRVMMKSAYTLIANHILYLVEVQTDDADWTEYQSLFDRILGSFTFGTN